MARERERPLEGVPQTGTVVKSSAVIMSACSPACFGVFIITNLHNFNKGCVHVSL